MSKRTKFLLGLGVIAALVIGWQVAAFAVHDTGVFELDGNATDDPTVAGDDWDTATAKTFISEPNWARKPPVALLVLPPPASRLRSSTRTLSQPFCARW